MFRFVYFIVLCIYFIINGCTHPVPENPSTAINQVINEDKLPKGKYILDDNYSANQGAEDIRSLNSIHTDTNNVNKKNTNELPEKILLKKFKELLVFHADDTMLIERSYIATLVMGKNQIFSTLKEEALNQSNASNNKIIFDTSMEFGSKMKARLIDMNSSVGKGFDIELIGGPEAEVQSISGKRSKAYWQWKLTPLSPGLKELKLSINVIEKDGEVVNLPARNIPIIIYGKEGFLYSTAQFFKSEGKWIITAICIPILIAIYTTRLKNRSTQKQ